MSVSQCTVSGNWPLTDGGQTATGQVMISPVAEVATPGAVIPVTQVKIPLVAGAISKQLNYVAGETQWLVTEQIDGATNPMPPYVVAPTGPTLDLSTASRSAPTATQKLYLLASSVDTAGGPVALDNTLHVPQQYLPSTAAGVQSVTNADGTIHINNTDPQNPVASVGIVPQSAVTDLVTDLTSLNADIAALAGAVVLTGSPSANNVPTWNGTHWVPQTPTGGGTPLLLQSGFITSGNVTLPSTGGNWEPVAGTQKTIIASLGDMLTAVFGFGGINIGSSYFDFGVLDGSGNLVRQLYSPMFPADPAYEGMPSMIRDPNVTGHSPEPPWFAATSTDIVGGLVTFCICQKGPGGGNFLMEDAVPVTYILKNAHH